MIKVAIIGGTGLENPKLLRRKKSVTIVTPYGEPSSDLITGNLKGVEVVIVSRHGHDHAIPPTQVNNRANIFAINELKCTHILATTACGSLRKKIERGDLVFPNQFIDFTRHRQVTFFEEFKNGDLKHTSMSSPFSDTLRKLLIKSAKTLNLNHHSKGTVITIEGPRFSTRAESRMFRTWGADIINMSTAPEIILANEIGIPYATIAMSTDYDSWKSDEKPVTWEEIINIFKANVKNVTSLILDALPKID